MAKLIKPEDYEVESLECIEYVCDSCCDKMFLPTCEKPHFNYCPMCGIKIVDGAKIK